MRSTGLQKFAAHLQTAPRQRVDGLQGLVAVGVSGEGDRVALPSRTRDLGAEKVGGVGLDDDLAVEIGPGAEAQVLVAGTGVTVSAGVKAAAIGVDRKAKTDVGTVVLRDDRPSALFEDLEPRLGRLPEPFRVGGVPGIRGIRDRQHDGVNLAQAHQHCIAKYLTSMQASLSFSPWVPLAFQSLFPRPTSRAARSTTCVSSARRWNARRPLQPFPVAEEF